ncbi:MAG: disulfide bond formation protein B, partial [Geminicoccaceae bacterium]
AGYHVSVEQGWLALPAGCAAGTDASSVEELKAMLKAAPPTCDQVTFTIFGLSLAAWNLVSSLALTLFTLIVLLASRRQNASMAHQT